MDVSLGIIFGIIAMIGFGLGTAFSKIPAKKIGSQNTLFFRGIFICLILFSILPLFLSSTTFSLKYIIIAFAISIIAFIPLFTFVKALSLGKLGIITPIANSSIIFTVLFSIILFNESLNSIQFGSIILIVFGIILISIDFKDVRNSQIFSMSSGIPYAIITCVLWGLIYSLFKIPVMVIGPILTSVITEIGIFIIAAFVVLNSKEKIKIPKKDTMIYILLFSLFNAIGSVSFNMGIMLSEVSIVAALTMANPLIATIYGKYVYKENINLQQYAAMFLMIIGVIILSVF